MKKQALNHGPLTNNRHQPLVSIIMPVYNARKFVGASIESILKQTEDNFEFLIIDDCSTDGSAEIIRKYAIRDKRIRFFQNKTNVGLVKSLNTLLPKTRGKFIARMDADDISLPNRLAAQVEFLEANPDIVACGGQEEIIDDQGTVRADKFFPTDSRTCYNMITNIMVIQPPLLMARGTVMRKLRYDNHIFKNDDISMHFKLLTKGNFSNVSEIIFQYRQLPNSLTHRNPRLVYFLALLVRLNAMYTYHFRPSVVNLIYLLPETLVVTVLPPKLIVTVFEIIRYTKLQHDTLVAKLRYLFARA
jgi:glycosyltransferase involved in cell wall biosynthesis